MKCRLRLIKVDNARKNVQLPFLTETIASSFSKICVSNNFLVVTEIIL